MFRKSLNKIKILFFACIIFFIAIPSTAISQSKLNFSGKWIGKLDVRGLQLRIVFNINKNDSGNFIATMDSPDQGVKGIKVDSVIINDNKIRLDVNIIHGFYEGNYETDSSTIIGTWNQNNYNFPLNLKPLTDVDVVKRPQTPKPPFPYNSEEVSYENKSASITLGGTITYPKEGSPFPAVLLITGSGQQDRDETLMQHKPFLVLADYLTRHGIEVLRVDDRGKGSSTGNFAVSTSADFAADVLAGVEYLKSRKEVDKNKIGLIGHSEGGLIAPMVAAETKDVAFIVLMAGPGLTGKQILLKQSALIKRANGAAENEIKKDAEISEKAYDIAINEKDTAKAREEMKTFLDKEYEKSTAEEKKQLGDKDALFNSQIRVLLSPWFKFFLAYDPVPTLEKVKCPVLAINGSKDLQVPPKEDLKAIKEALEKGGNKNFEVKELEGLNHLFQTAKSGSPMEYGAIEETLSPLALETITNWILKITKN